MSSSLVISDISVTTNENDIQSVLMKKYDGVVNVTRWYFDFDGDYPMSCVQVDFSSPEKMRKVLVEGAVVISGISRRVSIVERPQQCYRCHQTGHKTSDCRMKSFNEDELMNVFEQQRRRLSEVMITVEGKLNAIIAGR